MKPKQPLGEPLQRFFVQLLKTAEAVPGFCLSRLFTTINCGARSKFPGIMDCGANSNLNDHHQPTG